MPSEILGATAPPGRRRKTRRSVLIVDRTADLMIRIGGICVILAVFGIMAYLIQVTVPLFSGARVSDQHSVVVPQRGEILMEVLDEYRTMAVSIDRSGKVAVVHLESGRVLSAPAFDFAQKTPTAFARSLAGRDIVFGFDDGTVRFGTLAIVSETLPISAMPQDVEKLSERDFLAGGAVYSIISDNQIRKLTIENALEEPNYVEDGNDRPIIGLYYRLGGTAERPTRSFASLSADGVVRLGNVESATNILTGETTSEIAVTTLPSLPPGAQARSLLVPEGADQVYVASTDNKLHRFDTRDFDAPVLAESRQLFADGVELTMLGFLIGEQSIVAGGSDGSVDIYFRLLRPDAGTKDGYALVLAHRLEKHSSAVNAFDASERSKMFVTADASGEVWVRHSTSERTVLKLTRSGPGAAWREVVLAPRDNAVFAVASDGAAEFWGISAPHPETTLGTIFGKVWYEGYPEPDLTWQSSSGSDSFEPKLSLVPLIFGTVKATVYSLLFAIPVALLGAIYTSEFVHRRVRSIVKPTMELMASLPSVVLGFLAALVIAPVVETWISAIILGFALVPFGLLLAAHFWQILPQPVALRWGGLPKFATMFIVIGLALFGAYWLSPAFEGLFFAGDFKAWVNGTVGSGVPLLTLLLLPLATIAIRSIFNRVLGELYRMMLRKQSSAISGLLDFAVWTTVLIAGAGLSFVLAAILAGMGLDPRGGVFDTYVQRNTLVVGFAMGFAVIPIIYSIAEDALNAVPEHLRAASLACGATPWQSAVTIILPTAMSGVFAAVMIGMGRAVGETMIVVMAAGNTPLIDWNIFNGLRALSATIAVELPEAVRGGSLYRMLFLAALALFIMTFVINTVAELVRLRFRRRAAQL
ncbi:MAG TPA: ABC transporter permease subunit [Alphaproteobacteria bacterium]|nr:ABC transporter permease subunit [Alphaproteobacteria bacterium]